MRKEILQTLMLLPAIKYGLEKGYISTRNIVAAEQSTQNMRICRRILANYIKKMIQKHKHLTSHLATGSTYFNYERETGTIKNKLELLNIRASIMNVPQINVTADDDLIKIIVNFNDFMSYIQMPLILETMDQFFQQMETIR